MEGGTQSFLGVWQYGIFCLLSAFDKIYRIHFPGLTRDPKPVIALFPSSVCIPPSPSCHPSPCSGSDQTTHKNVNGDGDGDTAIRHSNPLYCLPRLNVWCIYMNIDPGKQLETVVSPLETAARVRAHDVKSHGVAEYIYYADTVWSVLCLAWPRHLPRMPQPGTGDRRCRPGNIETIQCSAVF